MPSTRTVFCCKELREKVEARIGLFRTEVSAHGPIICCNQLRENIGAKVSAHEPIFNLWQRL